MHIRPSDSLLLSEAFCFAAMKHRDQRRKDAHGSPFINHPIEAAHLLAGVGGVTDPTTLAATVLHDTLEDTSTSPREIEGRFGTDVCRLVEEVTDTPGLSTKDRRHRQLAWVKAASPRARLIRLADKTANLGALPHDWTPVHREEYLRWMTAMGSALGGTNAPLEALLAERLRQAWVAPRVGLRTPQRPAAFVPDLVVDAPCADDLARAIRRLQTQLSNAELLADDIAYLLSSLGIHVIHRQPVTKAAEIEPPPRKKHRRFDDPRLRALAQPGVGTLALREHDARTVMVSIDGAAEFGLSPTLALLVRILAFSAGPSLDGFPPFQPNPDIAAALSAVTGRHVKPHAIVVAIGRLREELQETGHVSPLLVETAAKRGARFRIRR